MINLPEIDDGGRLPDGGGRLPELDGGRGPLCLCFGGGLDPRIQFFFKKQHNGHNTFILIIILF